ncbi:MAG: heme-binding protein [Clostridia bacterium]|nr:heme-binding protein [Clostridia bacterium]
MTIDEMLREVAKRTGAAPVKKPEPQKTNIPDPPIQRVPAVSPAQLLSKPAIGLALAKEIVHCVEQAAEALGVRVVIAITDEAGRLILLEAMDGSYIASITAAQDKAFTAVALKMPTHEALAASRGGALDGLTNGNGILMLGGGYPMIYSGSVIGGIGVSGGTKEQDMSLARAGILYFEKRIK